MASDNGIEVEGLVRVFGDDIRAVDGVDLSVAPGEIYGFLGPNGAGKSTMVLMLVTLLPPTAGHATVAGFDVAKQGPQVRGQIGAALQESALDDFLTGNEHMDLQGGLHGLSKNERRRRGAELDRSRNTCGFELLLPYGDAVMLDATGGATGGAAGWCVRANLVAPGRLVGMDEPPAHIAGSLPEAALFRKMRAHARASGQPFAVTVCGYTIPERAPPAKRARACAPRMKAIEEAEVAARATDTPIPRPVSVETQ